MEICDSKICTGCGACKQACPKHCISLIPDEMDALHPKVDENMCVSCGKCQKVCPNNYPLEFHSTLDVYVAWSRNDEQRRTSASGGIASELYTYAINNGWLVYGVTFTKEASCHFIELLSIDDIKKVKNSKYCFSNVLDTYILIQKRLRKGENVLFIGLPCQVAGLYSFLGKKYSNLFTVDLLCHGSTPQAYLEQHIRYVENKTQQSANAISFRDSSFGTEKFYFTIYNDSKRLFYKKTVLSNDNYQLGYHHALTYRDNCYNCRYARPERCSDLTIGDYYGIGKHKASAILINSNTGKELFSAISDNLYTELRPKGEIFRLEHQLQSPSDAHPQRSLFEKIYKKTGNFELACDKSLKKDKKAVLREQIVRKIKALIRQILKLNVIRK